MMTKSEKIRKFVREHAGAGKQAIIDGTGVDAHFVTAICGQRVKADEFKLDKDGGYTLNGDYVRGSRTVSRLPKKVRGFRAEKRARKAARGSKLKSVADVARKHAGGVCVAPSPVQMHVRTTFTVLEAVIDLDGAEPMLQAAFRAHKEALEIAGA